MAPKATRRRDDDDEDDEQPSFKMQRGSGLEGFDSSRKSKLKAYIIGLNNQFKSWITTQASTRGDELWTQGVRDYLKHVEGLMDEFKDVMPIGSGSVPGSFGTFKASNGRPTIPDVRVPQAGSNSGWIGANYQDPSSSVEAAQAPPKTAAAEPAQGLFSFLAAPSSGHQVAKPPSASTTFAFGTSAAASSGAAKSDAGPAPPKKVASFNFLSPEADTTGSAAPEDAPSGSAAASAPQSLFSFGAPAPDALAAEKPPSMFSFGGGGGAGFGGGGGFGSAAPTTSSAPFTFGSIPPSSSSAGADAPSAAPPSSLFSFGSNPSSTAAAPASTAPSSMFSFGPSAGASTAAAGSLAPAGIFGFGGPAVTAATVAGAGNDAEGDDEGPQKFESEVAVSEDSGNISFKAKAKFSHMTKDEAGKPSWDGKGVGTLMLRVRNDGSNKPFVTFTTEAGRVLFIANVSKTMNVILVEGRNNVTFAAPWSPDGIALPTLQNVMFMLPKGRNLDFKAEVEKVQGVM